MPSVRIFPNHPNRYSRPIYFVFIWIIKLVTNLAEKEKDHCACRFWCVSLYISPKTSQRMATVLPHLMYCRALLLYFSMLSSVLRSLLVENLATFPPIDIKSSNQWAGWESFVKLCLIHQSMFGTVSSRFRIPYTYFPLHFITLPFDPFLVALHLFVNGGWSKCLM